MTTPTPAQTNNVMLKDYCGRDRDFGVDTLHGEHITLLTSVRDSADHILNQNTVSSNNILRGVGEVGNHLLNQNSVLSNRVSDIGEKNLVGTKDNALFLSQNQCGITKDIANSTRDILQELCHVGRNVDRNIDDVSKQLGRNHAESLVAFRDVQTETLRARAAIEKDICETKGYLDLQVMKSKCELERQAADNYAAVQLEAAKNKDALTMQMAECCCEIKQKIEQRYNNTVEVIKDLNLQNVRDELAQARQDLLVAKLGGISVGVGGGVKL